VNYFLIGHEGVAYAECETLEARRILGKEAARPTS